MELIFEYAKKAFLVRLEVDQVNEPGVWEEVGLCICTGKIVKIHGPFPCGQWPDIKVFWHALISELEEGEKVEADLGYRGKPRHVNEGIILLLLKDNIRNLWYSHCMKHSTTGLNNGTAYIGFSPTMNQSMDLSSSL